MIRGVDVSVMQGKNIPWAKLKVMDVFFAYIRCKVGNNPGIDTNFVENARGAKEAGIRSGAYFFPFPLPHIDPVAEVDVFTKSAEIARDAMDPSPLGTYVGELPPAYDLEWPPPEEWAKHKCSASQIRDYAKKGLTRLRENFGCKPVLYTYPYIWKMISVAGEMEEFSELAHLWIAGGRQYVNGDGHVPNLEKEQPPILKEWGVAWTFWQHDGNGGAKLPNGVDVDFNVFNGSLEYLDALCGTTVAEPKLVDDVSIETMRALSRASSLLVEDELTEYRKQLVEKMSNE